MTRRLFLTCSGLGAAVVLGGAWFHALGTRRGLSYSELPQHIKALYRQDFARALPALSLDDLLAELGDLGVYRRGGFHISHVRVNAADDPLIEFDGFLYTKSELLLYAAVARLHSRTEAELPPRRS